MLVSTVPPPGSATTENSKFRVQYTTVMFFNNTSVTRKNDLGGGAPGRPDQLCKRLLTLFKVSYRWAPSNPPAADLPH